MKTSEIKTLASYGTWPEDHGKDFFHRASKAYLNMIAKLMGLNKGEFEVRSNRGGDAVMGDVILHTDRIYVCLCGFQYGRDPEFYYRTVKGRKDYTGGPNLRMRYCELANPEAVAQKFLAAQRKD